MQTYLAGTLAGAGSFRCHSCGFHVALHALDQMPECPNCGEQRFARASMFDVAEPDQPSLHEDEDQGWLDAVRDGLGEPGQFLAFRDGDRVSVLPLLSEWTRIGRSLAQAMKTTETTTMARPAQRLALTSPVLSPSSSPKRPMSTRIAP